LYDDPLRSNKKIEAGRANYDGEQQVKFFFVIPFAGEDDDFRRKRLQFSAPGCFSSPKATLMMN
jgi:hypothetical protein